jgi:hypothetical protein
MALRLWDTEPSFFVVSAAPVRPGPVPAALHPPGWRRPTTDGAPADDVGTTTGLFSFLRGAQHHRAHNQKWSFRPSKRTGEAAFFS